jgi:poly(3-hydroxybutyrate) depolymerase
LYEVFGGGHVEPSIREHYSAIAELYLGRQNHDIEMALEIWNFFKDQTL